MMHDEEGFVRIGAYARRLSAAGRIVEDQTDDIGVLLVAQLLQVLERSNAVDHAIKMIEVIRCRNSS